MRTSIFAPDKDRMLCLSFYHCENNGEYVGTTIWLTPERAREIGAELIDVANKYPPVAARAISRRAEA